jgi:PilZ domain
MSLGEFGALGPILNPPALAGSCKSSRNACRPRLRAHYESEIDMPVRLSKSTAQTQLEIERRRTIRITYRDLKVTYDGMTDWVEVRSPDLSPDGLFLNTTHEFRPGTHLKLCFELSRTGVLIQAMGDVRYCLPGLGVGVEFVDLPARTRGAIEKELEVMQK